MTANLSKKKINLEICPPSQAKILVKVGDRVLPGDLLFSQEDEFEKINLAKTLSVSPSKVSKCLLLPLGSKVKKGQALAKKKGFFKKTVFKSPFSGTLESLSEDGILKIKKEVKKKKNKAPAKGTVKKASKGEILLEVSTIEIAGNWAVGSSGWGDLKLVSSVEDVFSRDEEIKGKILIFKDEVSTFLIYKAEALGVVGLVAGKTREDVRCESMAVLVLGDKEGVIPESLWQKLKEFEQNPVRILPEKNLLVVSL